MRNLTEELSYWVYNDPEYGDDITNLDYPALIELLNEFLTRIEELESRLDKIDPPMNDVFGPTGLIGDPQ